MINVWLDRCKEVTELQAENASLKAENEKLSLRLVLFKCKDCADITSLREEAALYQKEWAILREEVERLKKELRILYASNADIFARAEQAERELAELQGKLNTAYSYIRLVS